MKPNALSLFSLPLIEKSSTKRRRKVPEVYLIYTWLVKELEEMLLVLSVLLSLSSADMPLVLLAEVLLYSTAVGIGFWICFCFYWCLWITCWIEPKNG
jgi:hypothetical protein